jgi:hypothetical protein
MTDPKAQEYKSAVYEVNRILYEEWAPIGSRGELPLDEYEGYAMRVVSMLVAGESEAEIVGYLLATESEVIGVGEHPERARNVAGKIMALWENAYANAL